MKDLYRMFLKEKKETEERDDIYGNIVDRYYAGDLTIGRSEIWKKLAGTSEIIRNKKKLKVSN